jgi:hypothetical protein
VTRTRGSCTLHPDAFFRKIWDVVQVRAVVVAILD